MVCLILGFLSAVPSVAQTVGCADLIRAIYKKMAGEQSTPGSICRLRYTITTTVRWQGRTKASVTSAEMLVSDAQIYVASGDMEMGQDATTAVMVLPSRHQIRISMSNLDAFRRARSGAMAGFRDSLINTSDVTECTTLSDNVPGADRKVTFRLKPGARQRLKIESVTMYVNSAGQSLKKIVVVPTADNSVAGLEVTFNSIDYNYSTDRFSRPLLSQFIDGRGQPLAKYRGYTISDARRNSR
jgi:hypothetical protein